MNLECHFLITLLVFILLSYPTNMLDVQDILSHKFFASQITFLNLHITVNMFHELSKY